MDGGLLLGAVGGAARANQNKAKIVKIAVPVLVLAVLAVLVTAAAVSMAPDGPARLHALFCSKNFQVMCVVCQINMGCLFAREAARARTPAARRFWAVGVVACFLELALKLYTIPVVCRAAVEDGA
ncbi:unnamed protein product [Triticum aestivum]|uniref:Uncharacterized protein n=2 Tax=Triticum aestivum TaxID=4565 RepID=A0A9R1ER63_WHEAT|nr:uncharacterized protein LOC123052222 [Triticum aestivum]KAF7015023.1 hypothetical protein CFC21_028939 [Triticum aestivum]SPT17127.1 unnamed protein product [Triticum aestivum]